MKHSLYLIFFFVFISISGYSQEKQDKKVTGTIIDIGTGAPIEGVTIYNKTSKIGTLSNTVGAFSITANKGDIIQFSIISYKIFSVTVDNSRVLAIKLESTTSQLNEVVLVGNRGSRRTKIESPVPVDVINVNSVGQSTAKPDLMSQLNMSVPSFNYNKQSGADGSDANDFASLRGLGFDQTLVLINGKRRHLSSFINQLGTRGRGNSGYDLNAIPENSIDRIEILRDGASAQYGSDAIAGVINIILKRNINQLRVDLGGSEYYDHKYNSLNAVDPSQYYTGTKFDGKTFTIGLNYGFPIGKDGGFFNIGANYIGQGKTFRQQPDTNLAANPQALHFNTIRRAFGDGSIQGAGFMVNSEIPLTKKTSLYFFGGYNYKLSNVYAYTRNGYSSSDSIKYPIDAQNHIIYVPSIMHTAKDGSVFYNPQEDVRVQDGSFSLGLKGEMGKNWNWDLNNVIGSNDFHYFGLGTFNASLSSPSLQASKNNFNDGGFSYLQNTLTADITRHYDDILEGFNLSFGAEYRYENYKIYAGEPDSYGNGGGTFLSGGIATPKASGSQGFPGFQPGDEVNAHRSNEGVYLDAALDFSKKWLVDGAIRFENYSDFGAVFTYKLASRYKLAPNFNLRGSISSGYRAPSLQQLNFSNTNTNFVGGILQLQKLIPNYSQIARAAGIPPLKQEQATNASLGFSWNPIAKFTMTIDGYWVKIKNRIVNTGTFDTTNAALKSYLKTNQIKGADFFVNAVNTTNYGVDIVLDYSTKWANQHFKALLAGNFQHINIDKINIPTELNQSYANQQAFYSTREQLFLKASAPAAKLSLGLEYGIDKFSIGSHITYFGKITTAGFGANSVPGAAPGGPGGAGISDTYNGWDPYIALDNGSKVVPEYFVFHGKVSTDLYVSFKFTKQLSAYLGVDNLFNVHPDQSFVPGARLNDAYGSESGGPFDSVQMGFNGTRIFSKLSFTF